MYFWQWQKYNPMMTPQAFTNMLRKWRYDSKMDPNTPENLAGRRELDLPLWASKDDVPMAIVNTNPENNLAHNPHMSMALYEICKKSGMDVEIYMKTIVNNYAAEWIGMHYTWLIQKLTR